MEMVLMSRADLHTMFREVVNEATAPLNQIINEMKELFYLVPGQCNDNKLMTHKEASEFMSISEQTLARWREKGKVPYQKVGNNFRYIKSDVLKASKIENKKKGGFYA